MKAICGRNWTIPCGGDRTPLVPRIKKALEELGNPHLQLRNVIHIAGTNGKGSTANFIRQILEEAGYKVAMFTSPHFIEHNERIYCNGRTITDAEIEEYKQIVAKNVPEIEHSGYFTLSCLIAVLWYAKMQPDFCIFEANMGGRYDDTNFFDKVLASVIVSISLDHTKYLGNTLEKIAYEKAGIIKRDCPVFTSNTKQSVLDIIEEEAKLKNARLIRAGKDYFVDTTLKPSLLGQHQFENASLAQEVCRYIGIDEDIIKKGISNTFWRGRLEKLQIKGIDADEIFFDGAHNEDGIKRLCEFVSYYKNKIIKDTIKDKKVKDKKSKNLDGVNFIGIFSCLAKKKPEVSAKYIIDAGFDELLFYKREGGGFKKATELVDFYRPLFVDKSTPCGIVEDLDDIAKKIKPDKYNVLFFFGSLYFIGYLYDKEKDRIIENIPNNNIVS